MFGKILPAVLAALAFSCVVALGGASREGVSATQASATGDAGVYHVTPLYETIAGICIMCPGDKGPDGRPKRRHLKRENWSYDAETGNVKIRVEVDDATEMVLVSGKIATPRAWVFGKKLDPKSIRVVINDRTLVEGEGYTVDRKRGIITVTDSAAEARDVKYFIATGSHCIGNYSPMPEKSRPVIGIGAAPGKRGSGRPQPGKARPVKAGSGTCSFSGQVIDSKGKPVHGAEIGVSCFEYNLHKTLRTDKEGRYAVVGLKAGFYSINLEKGRSWNGRHKTLKLSKGDAAVVDFVPLEGAAAFCGEVQDKTGKPIAKCYISINNIRHYQVAGCEKVQDHVWTDGTGFFAFDNLPPSKYDVTISCAGVVCISPAGTFALEKDVEREVTIKVLPGEVAGVVRVEGGIPEGSRSIVLYIRKEGEFGKSSWSAKADSAGRFTIQNLPPGKFTAQAYLKGFYSEPFAFKVAKRKKGRKLELSLRKAGSLLLRVFDKQGRPVEHVSISEFLPGNRSRSVISEKIENGVFRIFSIAPGRRRFGIRSSEIGTEETTVEIASGKETEVEVTI